jgi:hypothetical protein
VRLQILSIGGTHTNAFLRAVKAGCRSAVPKLADEHGNLDLARLTMNRESFKEACVKGLKWFVIHWQAPAVWPGLVKLVQSALNTHARGAQSEVEVMLDMFLQAQDAAASGADIDWRRIQEHACYSLPPCAPYIGVLSKYVQSNAGGATGELLQDLSKFQKAFACSQHGPSRILGSEYIAKVGGLAFGSGEKYPYLQNACLEANLSSPKVVDGVCKLLLPSHLSTLTVQANRPSIKECETLMSDARKLCKKMSVDEATRVLHVGKLDVRCILHLAKKGNEGEGKEYKSFSEIAQVVRQVVF